MTYEPFEVVAVPFPFTDRRATRRRPAVVVSTASFNRDHRQAILAMITTAPEEWPSDVVVGAWREAGLRIPCKIRFELFTLDEEHIVEPIGRLAGADCDAVRTGLGQIVTLAQ